MAKLRLSALVTQASGRVGGSQFVRSTAGTILRLRANRRPVPSTLSIAALATMGKIRQSWERKSTSTQLFWKRLAQELTWRNRLDQNYHPSAYQAYARYMSYWSRFNVPSGISTPSSSMTDQPTLIEYGCNISGFFGVRITTPATTDTIYCGIYGAVIFHPNRKSGYPPFRFITTVKNLTTITNIFDDWAAVLPALQAYQWYALKIVCFDPANYPASPVIVSNYSGL